jgi:hypothetical protein
MSILDRLVGQVIVLVRVCLSVCVWCPNHLLDTTCQSVWPALLTTNTTIASKRLWLFYSKHGLDKGYRGMLAPIRPSHHHHAFTLSRLSEACQHATKRWARNEWTRGAPRLITASQCPSMCSSCQLMAAPGSFSAESSLVVR